MYLIYVYSKMFITIITLLHYYYNFLNILFNLIFYFCFIIFL